MKKVAIFTKVALANIHGKTGTQTAATVSDLALGRAPLAPRHLAANGSLGLLCWLSLAKLINLIAIWHMRHWTISLYTAL